MAYTIPRRLAIEKKHRDIKQALREKCYRENSLLGRGDRDPDGGFRCPGLAVWVV